MNMQDRKDYDVEVGEPYLSKDIDGKYVILQDETLTMRGKNSHPIDQVVMHSAEILIDPDPSDAEIFRMKLKGAIRGSWPF